MPKRFLSSLFLILILFAPMAYGANTVVSAQTPTPVKSIKFGSFTPPPTRTPTQTPVPLWPCEGSQEASTPYEIDRTVSLSLEPGQAFVQLTWMGSCPAVDIQSDVPVPYTESYRIRIASDEALGRFYVTSGDTVQNLALFSDSLNCCYG